MRQMCPRLKLVMSEQVVSDKQGHFMWISVQIQNLPLISSTTSQRRSRKSYRCKNNNPVSKFQLWKYRQSWSTASQTTQIHRLCSLDSKVLLHQWWTTFSICLMANVFRTSSSITRQCVQPLAPQKHLCTNTKTSQCSPKRDWHAASSVFRVATPKSTKKPKQATVLTLSTTLTLMTAKITIMAIVKKRQAMELYQLWI